MLLVGAYRYGFGNWEAMQKDPKLGLEGKFFLEEGKKGEDSASRPIPNAIHLVRRGDFLLGVLHEYEDKLRLVESSWRNKGSIKTSTSPPPAPVASTSYSNDLKRCAESEAVASIDDGSSKKRKRRPTPTFTDSETSDEWCA
jgi:chromodomain-helicase-DNA-binding protein 1